jgi:heme-degrading monooxygenase HmoA
MLAATPEPPYVAVIFTNQRTDGDKGYATMAEEMVCLAAQQPGYLGMESARDAAGFGITVSYWATEEDAVAWRDVADHREAQRLGFSTWYAGLATRVAVVHRHHIWHRPD